MRVLVTGSSGHVGGAIARGLRDGGHAVVGLSRRPAPWLAGAEEHLVELGTAETVAQIRASIERCDAIVHAAADLSKDDFASSIARVNGFGTLQMLEIARAWHVECFVFISGVNVIGLPREHPISEEHPTAPRTAYHASKLYGEHLTLVTMRDVGRAVVLRLTAPVGPHMARNRIMPAFVDKALRGERIELLGSGSRIMNYVDEMDFARATALALESRADGIFNVGGMASISNIDLARAVVTHLHSRSEIGLSDRHDPEDGIDWTPDLRRADRVLGYRPLVTLETMVDALAGAGL